MTNKTHRDNLYRVGLLETFCFIATNNNEDLWLMKLEIDVMNMMSWYP